MLQSFTIFFVSFFIFIFLAPSVKPIHSWSMMAQTDGKISGNPELHTHGDFKLVNTNLLLYICHSPVKESVT